MISEFIHGAGIDEPLALKRNDKVYYYHADVLGSIMAITDAAGTRVQRYEYDAYGNIVYTENPGFKQPYTYTGREYDEESGLYFYRARYYDAAVGRFISSDPIGLAGGLNTYAYVGNSPANFTDPSGLISPAGAVAGAVCFAGVAAQAVGDFKEVYDALVIANETFDEIHKIEKDCGSTPEGMQRVRDLRFKGIGQMLNAGLNGALSAGLAGILSIMCVAVTGAL